MKDNEKELDPKEKAKQEREKKRKELLLMLLLLYGWETNTDRVADLLKEGEDSLPSAMEYPDVFTHLDGERIQKYLDKYERAVKRYEEYKAKKAEVQNDENLTEEDKAQKISELKEPKINWEGLQKEAFTIIGDIAVQIGLQHVRLEGPLTETSCADCRKWHHQIISVDGKDKRYPSLEDFTKEHHWHPNCVHFLLPYKPQEEIMNTENNNTEEEKSPETVEKTSEETKETTETTETTEVAKEAEGTEEQKTEEPKEEPKNVNSEPDTEVVMNSEPVKTKDFGETLVLVAPIGTFYGSDANGNAVEEVIDGEVIDTLIENISGEILVDKDHESAKGVSERDTEAMAWATDFRKMIGFGAIDGLYCTLKWTEEGRKLAESRAYRFLSPTWTLDSMGKPNKLMSIALTNRPAIKTKPILNTEPEIIHEDPATTESVAYNTKPMNDFIEQLKTITGKDTEEDIIAFVQSLVAKKAPKKEVIKEEILNSEPNMQPTAIPDKPDILKELSKLHGDDYVNFVKRHRDEVAEAWKASKN